MQIDPQLTSIVAWSHAVLNLQVFRCEIDLRWSDCTARPEPGCGSSDAGCPFSTSTRVFCDNEYVASAMPPIPGGGGWRVCFVSWIWELVTMQLACRTSIDHDCLIWLPIWTLSCHYHQVWIQIVDIVYSYVVTTLWNAFAYMYKAIC